MHQVLDENWYEQNNSLFTAIDYHLLRTANPTDKKGKPKTVEKLKYTSEARKLRKKYLGLTEKSKKPPTISIELKKRMEKRNIYLQEKYKLKNRRGGLK